MNGVFVDRIWSLRYQSYSVLSCATFEICAHLPPYLTHLLPRAFRAVKISRRLSEIIGALWSSSGLSLMSSANGGKPSKRGSLRSNIDSHVTRAENYPKILIPQVLDLIRHCGRRGDEKEARRLYLTYGVDFREYRRTYRDGRRKRRA